MSTYRFGLIGRRALGAASACLLLLGAIPALAWPDNPSDEWQALIEAATAEGGVTVLANANLGDDFIATFSADTGVPITLSVGRHGEGRARFNRETETGQATFDAFIGGRSSYELADKGLLTAVAPLLILPEVTDGANWRDSAMPWIDSAKTYLPMPIGYVSAFVLINKDVIDPASVTVWDDLLSPDLAGRIAMHDPTVPGGTGAGASVSLFLAEAKGQTYLETLYGTQIGETTADYRQLVDWVARGTYPVVLGTRALDIERYRAEGVDNLAVLNMQDVPGYISGGTSIMAIPASAPNKAAAQVFANWFLSRSGQAAFARAARAPSFRTDVTGGDWPEYLNPEPGRVYINQYDQSWAETVEPALRTVLDDVLSK